jgi:hypothetical protein
MRGAIPPLSQYFFMVWCLFKRRDNYAFTFYYNNNNNNNNNRNDDDDTFTTAKVM